MHALFAIAANDLRHLARDRMSLFFAAVFPVIIAVFFGTIFSGPGKDAADAPRITLLVCDEDATPRSAALISSLAAARELALEPVPERDPALNLVRAGKAPALLVIPKGYAAQQDAMFSGSAAELLLAVDPSRRAEGGMLEGILTRESFAQLQSVFTDSALARTRVKSAIDRLHADPAVTLPQRLVMDRFYTNLDTFLQSIPAAAPPAAATTNPADPTASPAPTTAAAPRFSFQPITITRLPLARPERRNAPPSSFAITFAQGVIWGVMGCALGFSMALTSERSRGTMLRLRVAPIAPAHILAGKALACFIATLAVGVMVLLVGVAFFSIRPTSIPLLALALVCVAVCFVGIMMLLAAFGRTERGGNSLGWGVLLILSMIGGGMLPLFFMPAWMQSISVVSPIRYAVLALEGAIWRDFSLTQMLAPCAALLAVGALGLLVGARLVARHVA